MDGGADGADAVGGVVDVRRCRRAYPVIGERKDCGRILIGMNMNMPKSERELHQQRDQRRLGPKNAI